MKWLCCSEKAKKWSRKMTYRLHRGLSCVAYYRRRHDKGIIGSQAILDYSGCIHRLNRATDENASIKLIDYGQHQTAVTLNHPICLVDAFKAKVSATALTLRDRIIQQKSNCINQPIKHRTIEEMESNNERGDGTALVIEIRQVPKSNIPFLGVDYGT